MKKLKQGSDENDSNGDNKTMIMNKEMTQRQTTITNNNQPDNNILIIAIILFKLSIVF